jgi:transposase InsO family protein
MSMPWEEFTVMEQKLKFIARLLEGEQMALLEQKRTPYRYANKLPIEIEALILEVKREYPTWGAPKIREKIIKKYPDVRIPAKSTIHAVLDRNGLVDHRTGRIRYKSTGTVLEDVKKPNQLWCADYKGEFMMGNRQYCYPLTITDYASRYLLACDSLSGTKEVFAFDTFTRAFQEFGLPDAIRTDNGVPFASGASFYNLTKLSVWWMRLGIQIERIEPGKPQQNGRHERMHLTLKQEATRPPRENLIAQQEQFDKFMQVYNHERPHEGINNKYPSEVYNDE